MYVISSAVTKVNALNETILKLLRTSYRNTEEWDIPLPFITFAHNSLQQSTKDEDSFTFIFNRHVRFLPNANPSKQLSLCTVDIDDKRTQ